MVRWLTLVLEVTHTKLVMCSQILQIKETANPFSLAVFNENLFWSDAKRRVVLSAHKTTGKNSQVLLKRLRQPFAVKVRGCIKIMAQLAQYNPVHGIASYSADHTPTAPDGSKGTLPAEGLLPHVCAGSRASGCLQVSFWLASG